MLPRAYGKRPLAPQCARCRAGSSALAAQTGDEEAVGARARRREADAQVRYDRAGIAGQVERPPPEPGMVLRREMRRALYKRLDLAFVLFGNDRTRNRGQPPTRLD